MLEKAKKLDRNISPAKPDAVRAFERFTSTEPLYDARLTELAAQPNRIKNNRAFRFAQLLALTFALTTSLAERTVAQETITSRIEVGTEDAEQNKFEGMRTVFQRELSHIKSLGYELTPAPQLFVFDGSIFEGLEKDNARVLSETREMSRYATKFRELYAQGSSPTKNQLSIPIMAAANRLANIQDTFPVTNFDPYLSPLDYLSKTAPGVGEVSPDLLDPNSRGINLPMLSFQSSTNQQQEVVLTMHNWLGNKPHEPKIFPNVTDAAEYLLAAYAQEFKVAQSNLETVQGQRKENWNFALYADTSKQLTGEQQESIARLYERVQSVKITYEPEGRVANVEMYGPKIIPLASNTQKFELTKSMFDNANGHPLVLNRKILGMIFTLKAEFATVSTKYADKTHEIDADGNVLVHVRMRDEEFLNIQPRFAHCYEQNCTGQVPLNLDLRKLGLPQITGLLTQDMKAPIGQFIQHGPFKLYSGYSRDVVEQNVGKNSPEFARGISVMEGYFGVAPGTHVKGVFFTDIPAAKQKPNAGVDPQTPDIIDIEDLRDGDYHIGVGRHETVHVVDRRLRISSDRRFTALYDRIAKEQPALFNLISETHFLKDDSKGKEIGHAYSNPDELLASFINGFHASKWREQVGAFSPEQRELYRDMLVTLSDILRDKVHEKLLSPNAPIIDDIQAKISEFPPELP